MPVTRRVLCVAAVGTALALAFPAAAQKKYDSGASDTEIKIGNTMPYSGPASSYGTIGRAMSAYFNKVNSEGGVNGRKINFMSEDDGYSPPKTVEVVRKLVEQDQVLFTATVLGTPTNTAIHKYMNAKKVPQLFVATGATKWGDPKHFPWTMGWQPSYQTEGQIYGRYIAQHMPNAKIAILSQNDDSGKDYVKGFKDGLGSKANLIIAEQTYEVSDPTVDSQILALQASGADTFFETGIPKFAAMAIRKAYDTGWRPQIFLTSVGASVAAALEPAGLDKSVGIITAAYLKDPTDPRWANDQGFKDWLAFMKKWYPEGSLADSGNAYGYSVAQTIVQVIKQCGDTLTRENVMKQAASLKNVELPMLLPGIKVNTSATDFFPIEQMQLAKFDGKTWVLFGDLIGE
jgi:branched-chain amino acid transport system substrate-binding protein